MPGIVRETDTESGTCNLPCEHGGPIEREGAQLMSYSPGVFANDLAVVRETDEGLTNCPCGAVFTNVEGSPDVFVNNLAAVRIGDENVCNLCDGVGADTTGSGDVIVN